MKKIGLILLFSFLLLGCTTNAETIEQKEITVDEERVVTISDKTFEDEELAFYTLMNQIKLVLQLNESVSEEETAYLKEQQNYYENVNVNLQSMIELYAMSLLAEEKNYFVPDEKLRTAVHEYKKKVMVVNDATALINTFGSEKFNQNIEEYIRQTILRDRIAGELETEIAEENPDMDKKEVNYTLEGKYEDLLIDQMYSLDMEIHLQ